MTCRTLTNTTNIVRRLTTGGNHRRRNETIPLKRFELEETTDNNGQTIRLGKVVTSNRLYNLPYPLHLSCPFFPPPSLVAISPPLSFSPSCVVRLFIISAGICLSHVRILVV